MLTFVKESDDEDHLRGETHDPDSGVAHGAPAGLHWSNWGENAQVSIAAACCIWRPIDLEPNGCKIWQLTCFLRPTLWENWTTLKEWIFSLQETDFLKKSSMNIFGTYPDVHISVTQERFSNKIAFTIRHRLKSLLWHSGAEGKMLGRRSPQENDNWGCTFIFSSNNKYLQYCSWSENCWS